MASLTACCYNSLCPVCQLCMSYTISAVIPYIQTPLKEKLFIVHAMLECSIIDSNVGFGEASLGENNSTESF